MPRNTSGVYVPPVTSFSPAVSLTTMTASGWNTLRTDFQQEITNSLDRLGRLAMAADLPMGGFRITSVGSAVLASDVPAYSQLYTIPIGKNLTIAGSTSGTATIQSQAVQGTPTLTLPTVSGTIVTSATAPLAIDPVTGAISGAGISVKVTRFTAGGTFTRDANCFFAELICVGGGGGGGGGNVGGYGGGGAGAGGVTRAFATAAQIGASQVVTIGSAGTGGTSAPGTGGGVTSIGTLCVASGGGGGVGGISFILAGGDGAAIGSSSVSLVAALPGGDGEPGQVVSGGNARGGRGGESPGYGAGGRGGAWNSSVGVFAPGSGKNYGGGGGGGALVAGANGSAGFAVVIEYLKG